MKALIISYFISLAINSIHTKERINPNLEVYEIRERNNNDHGLYINNVYPQGNNNNPQKHTKLSKLLQRYNTNINYDKQHIAENDKVMTVSNDLIKQLNFIRNEGVINIADNDEDNSIIIGRDIINNDDNDDERTTPDKIRKIITQNNPENHVIIHLLKPKEHSKFFQPNIE